MTFAVAIITPLLHSSMSESISVIVLRISFCVLKNAMTFFSVIFLVVFCFHVRNFGFFVCYS